MTPDQTTLALASDASTGGTYSAPAGCDLKTRYLDAIKNLYCPWAEVHPRRRFSEFDQFRTIWTDELWKWIFGDNPRQVSSLTEFAWAVQHDRISEGGRNTICLNWSDKNQRVYLGDGLLEYLGLLKDEVEKHYGHNITAEFWETAAGASAYQKTRERVSHKLRPLVGIFIFRGEPSQMSRLAME